MEILYVEGGSHCPYVWTESTILQNIGKASDLGDFAREFTRGEVCAMHRHSELEPFIELLNSTGIEYTELYRDENWFHHVSINGSDYGNLIE